jgi:LPXTG-motif cell wall-anchored protein
MHRPASACRDTSEGIMDTNTLLIIILVVVLLGGGGFFMRGRR